MTEQFPYRHSSLMIINRRSTLIATRRQCAHAFHPPPPQLIHRRAAVLEYVAGLGGRIRLKTLPPYAPNLNPWDEGGWHHLKNVQLANIICRDVEELHEHFQLAVARLRRKPRMIHSFFQQAGAGM